MESGQIKTLSRASRSTWMILMMGIGFCAGGISLARQGNLTVGVSLAVAFGLMALVAFVTVLPGSASLSYDARGFWTTRLFQRGERIPWTAVSAFRVAEVEGEPRVVFDFTDAKARATDYRGAVRAAADAGGSLPDNYGQDAAILARELEAHRAHAIGTDS